MAISYDLSRLDPRTFEHLVNLIALKVLGSGHTGFGPGADGGRDGYFEGEAPYPSEAERWRGKWYIQCKFHAPNLSSNKQKWLLNQVKDEINLFKDETKKRKWPDIWIIATNVDLSGASEVGAFDQVRKLVAAARPKLAKKFHFWSGTKIISFLSLYPEIAKYYADFLTPGQLLSEFYNRLQASQASLERVIRYLTISQFVEQQYTKLEQAGSSADTRPGNVL